MTPAVRFPEPQVRHALPGIIDLRRRLHAIPEVGLDLPETAALVEAELRALGLAPTRVGSGMLADIGDRGPLVAIRADMDALPVEEKTGLAHASRYPRTTPAATTRTPPAWWAPPGCWRPRRAGACRSAPGWCSRPGEEGCFGARPLIAAGGAPEGWRPSSPATWAPVSCELGPGQAGVPDGPMMASSDRFMGAFIGSGGQAGSRTAPPTRSPAWQNTDPGLNSFRARELDQARPAVVSVCSIHGGEACNVIPERTEFKGTARAVHAETRAILAERIGAIAEGVARMHRLELDYQWHFGYPPVVNDVRASTLAAQAAREVLGAGRVVVLSRPSMGGEDFAYYLEKVPQGHRFLCTAAPERGIDRPNHNPRFDVDEDQLWALTAVNLAAAERLAAAFG